MVLRQCVESEVNWKSNIKGQPRRSTTSHQRGLRCFYVIICVSWAYEVLKRVIMMFIGSVWCFMRCEGQMSKTFKVSPWDMHVCVLMMPRMFGHVACHCFGWNLSGRSSLMFIITLEMSEYDFPRSPQETLKKDLKAIETLPWQCQSTS